MNNEHYTVVGYVGKSGKLGAYKKVHEVPDKFKPGQKRAKLISFDGKLEFWVDAAKLVDPPAQSEAARKRAPKRDCYSCGCEFTYAEAQRDGGDWSDSYCGC